MNDFKISYHNVDLDRIQQKLNDSRKKFDKINNIISSEASLAICNQTTDLDEIKFVANKLIENKDIFIVFGTGGSNLGSRALINILQRKHDKNIFFF